MLFLRKHLSYANVVATFALVFAMGGTAVAANHYLITKTSQIKPSVLKGLKVPGAVGKPGATGASGAPGPQGVAGNEGKQGNNGLPGKNGATSVVVRVAEGTAATGHQSEATADCNAGERATGGGSELYSGVYLGTYFVASQPVPGGAGETPTGWRVSWYNESGTPDIVHAYVVCASP